MNTKQTEALKLALEALETLMLERGSIYENAITALREALAEQDMPKIGCVNHDCDKCKYKYDCDKAEQPTVKQSLTVEPAQPSKPLTREEIIKAQRSVDPEGQDLCGWSFTEGIRWAEKHHGIKVGA